MEDNLKYLSVDDLIPYENNPRNNDEAVDYVAKSIEEFGFKVPIVVDKNNIVVAGHTRLKASKKLGFEKVPVIIADDLSDEKIKAFRIADNKVAEIAVWKEEELHQELTELEEMLFDMTEFGFDGIGELIDEEVEEDDFDIEEPVEPKAKKGDVYKLGEHRLMCGDSTSKEDIERLMNGVKADLVHTDPPYGMKKEKDGVLNDNLNYDDLLEFNKKWIPLTFDSLKDNGSWYCWGIDEPLMDIYSEILKPMINSQKVTFRNLITWDKGNGQGQLSELFRSYATADEKCLFVMCGVQGFSNNTEDYFEGWDSVRLYLEQEAKKSWFRCKEIERNNGRGNVFALVYKSTMGFYT